jgi:class 3 adenylate cyclase
MYVPIDVVMFLLNNSQCHERNRMAGRIPAKSFRRRSSRFTFSAMLMNSELELLSKRVVTLLVMDLVGFTSICESTKPELLMTLMSEYFQAMCSIISDCSGTLDKVRISTLMRCYIFCCL